MVIIKVIVVADTAVAVVEFTVAGLILMVCLGLWWTINADLSLLCFSTFCSPAQSITAMFTDYLKRCFWGLKRKWD